MLQQTTRFLESSTVYRILAEDSVKASTSTGGISSYVSSPTDDKISEDGAISVSTDYSSFGMKGTFSVLLLSFIFLLTQ